MTNGGGVTKLRCVHCREEVTISEKDAHGDHVRCGACGTDHRLLRGDRTRLVLADVTPLRDALAQNQQLVSRLDAELARARASFGIGVNGVGIGVIYAVYRLALGGASIDKALLWTTLVIALGSGLLLELANWAFLAKHAAISRLTQELAEARSDATRLRAQIREATRS